MHIREAREAAAAVARLVPRLARYAGNRLDQSDPPLGLTQFYVLQRIAEGTRRGTDLARRSGVSGPTMSGVLDRLAAAGLVRREADPADRRASAVTLTERGASVLAAGDRRLVDAIDSLLEGAPHEDRAAVVRACALIERALDARVAQRAAEATA